MGSYPLGLSPVRVQKVYSSLFFYKIRLTYKFENSYTCFISSLKFTN